MKKQDIKYLKCIYCSANLNIEEYKKKGQEIIEGKIFCNNCNEEWPIINGIPRILTKNLIEHLIFTRFKDFFLKYKERFNLKLSTIKDIYVKEKIKTASSFGFEWLKYSKVIKEFENDWKRYFLPYIYPKDINNKVVADIGCGLAKHGYFTAKYGAKYIGVDLSEAVDAAYRNTKKFNPLIIQADIYNLPLMGSLIDYYYSIGVIHHLPTPKEGFLRIVKLMKENSKMLIWVYGKEKNKRFTYIYEPLRRITTKLPKKTIHCLCHIPAIITHLLNLLSLGLEKIGLEGLAKKIPFYYYTNFPYNFKVNDSFDVLATPIQKNYSKEEIEQWFMESKLKEYKVILDIITGIKGYGIK